MSVVSFAAQLAAPWAHLYDDSKLISTAVTFTHLGGLLLGGGFAIAADRMTLRRAPADPTSQRAHLDELHAIHKPVLVGLTLTFVSGFLQLAADVKTFLPAPLFWVKMGVVALLLANGAMLQRTETALRRGTVEPGAAWRRLQQTAWASLGLWFGSVLLGTALLAI
jgi:hypothetical protein